jgi:hypothetical protein
MMTTMMRTVCCVRALSALLTHPGIFVTTCCIISYIILFRYIHIYIYIYVHTHQVIYMIVYNPSTNEEGIHTMKYPRGSDTEGELLITFEGLADCIEFSKVIKDDPGMQHEPVPTPTQTSMMENACKDMNLPMKIVPMEEQKEEK